MSRSDKPIYGCFGSNEFNMGRFRYLGFPSSTHYPSPSLSLSSSQAIKQSANDELIISFGFCCTSQQMDTQTPMHARPIRSGIAPIIIFYRSDRKTNSIHTARLDFDWSASKCWFIALGQATPYMNATDGLIAVIIASWPMETWRKKMRWLNTCFGGVLCEMKIWVGRAEKYWIWLQVVKNKNANNQTQQQ